MPIYTKIDIENFNQKDKRISFLSIFSSLLQNDVESADEAVEKAFEITEELYEKYPIKTAGDEGMGVIENGVSI